MKTAADRVDELIAQLDSLVDGETAAAHLVACGSAAIEPLRRFLLDSPPRAVAQPRCWAARALGGLGAKDVLVDYLRRDQITTDPALALSEEAVQRAAALALAGWRTDDVFDTLFLVALRRPIPGAIEALGAFERRDAVPLLLYALEEDFCRPWAEAALERTARRDRDLLIASAHRALPDGEREGEPSRRRRRAVVRLLREIPLAADEAHGIAALVESPDMELAVDAAAIVLRCGSEADVQRARGRLREIAPLAPWHLHADVQALLQTEGRKP